MDDGPIEATKREPSERVRDEKGRFVARPDVATEPQLEGKEGDQSQPDPAPEPPVDPNVTPKFKFAGREYDTQAEAEQRHKSLEGQFKPLSETAQRAAESATAWKGEAEKFASQRDALFAELQAVKATQSGQPADAVPKDQAETPAPESIDWELYAEITKQYTEAGTPWKAQQWLQGQIDAMQTKRETALREELSKPAKEAAAREAVAQQTDQLFSSLAEYNNEDGTPAYPELRDPEAAYAVGRFWTQMGLPKEYALKPQGAIAAIAMYRMASAAAAGSQGNPAPAPAPPTPEDVAGSAAADLAGGRPNVSVSPADASMSPEAARVIAGLKNTTLTRPGLGFEE
jgi:hypothetical protein